MQEATCRCGEVWDGGTRRAHCAACHRTFSNAKLFDAHRWARGRGHGCYTPKDMGLTQRDGTWYSDEHDG